MAILSVTPTFLFLVFCFALAMISKVVCFGVGRILRLSFFHVSPMFVRLLSCFFFIGFYNPCKSHADRNKQYRLDISLEHNGDAKPSWNTIDILTNSIRKARLLVKTRVHSDVTDSFKSFALSFSRFQMPGKINYHSIICCFYWDLTSLIFSFYWLNDCAMISKMANFCLKIF